MATLRSISHQGNYKHVPPRLAYLIRFLMALKNWEKEVWKEQKNKGTSKRGLVESVQIMQLGPVVEKKYSLQIHFNALGQGYALHAGHTIACECASVCVHECVWKGRIKEGGIEWEREGVWVVIVRVRTIWIYFELLRLATIGIGCINEFLKKTARWRLVITARDWLYNRTL